MKKSIDETLALNKKQKEFYNTGDDSKRNSLPTRIWFGIRNGLLTRYRKNFEISDRVYKAHREWLGDLSDKKVLDLGCLRGNVLSLYIAQNSKEYIGIDLSEVAISELSQKLSALNLPNARAIAVDFLSPEFEEKDFDIIYAYGVLHHFENTDVLFDQLNEKLKDGGIIISYDPLETSLPIRIIRRLYRPFQSDKEWEWPFTAGTLQKFDSSFEVIEKRGVLGLSKYGILIDFLPLNRNFKRKQIHRLIENDWNAGSWSGIRRCMHLTMKLRKKPVHRPV